MMDCPTCPALPGNLTADACGAAEPDLIELADLKWLMAGQGTWIDVPRLLGDRGYARCCLARAMSMPSDLIHRQARRALSPLV